MSNWGIGLLFTFGRGGRPDVLTLRDVEAHCPKCGREAIMRYYDALPFHSLTVRALSAALERACAPLHAVCAQCDADVGEADVVRWVLHYGFPSGRGLIQGFADTAGERQWLLSPHEAIDVQLVPRWDVPGDQSRREVPTLTEAAITEVFGRPMNAKQSVRRLLANDPRRGYFAFSADLAAVLVPEGTAEADVISTAQRNRAGEWVAAPLQLGGAFAHGFPACATEWLGDLDPLARTDVWGVADAGCVDSAAQRVLAGFPIQVGVERTPDETLAMILPDRGSLARDPIIDPREVALEAARSMMDPSDTTRLEIDRLLHGLTGLWTAQDGEEAAIT